MTNTISVPRDLLIDVRDSTNEAGNLSYRQHHIDHHRRLTRKLDELLEAPAVESVSIGEGLEAIAWQDAENPQYTTGEKRQMHAWVTDGYPIVPLCSMPKAQAIIDALRTSLAATVKDSLTAGKAQMARDSAELRRLCADRDQLKAKRDYANQVIDQRNGMLTATQKQLDEARDLLTVASEIIHEQAIHIERPMTDLGSESLTRIDAWLEANQ